MFFCLSGSKMLYQLFSIKVKCLQIILSCQNIESRVQFRSSRRCGKGGIIFPVHILFSNWHGGFSSVQSTFDSVIYLVTVASRNFIGRFLSLSVKSCCPLASAVSGATPRSGCPKMFRVNRPLGPAQHQGGGEGATTDGLGTHLSRWQLNLVMF